MNTRKVTTHLPVELAARLDALAGELGRPRGSLVKEAIQAFLELEAERRRETIAALQSVDEGALVEHGDVEAWLHGLPGGKRARRRVERAG